jgi:hypothetical protein
LMQFLSRVEPLAAEDIAEAIRYIVTRPRRVAINEILIREWMSAWFFQRMLSRPLMTNVVFADNCAIQRLFVHTCATLRCTIVSH